MAPTQLCARAHNWVKAIELGAFVKGAFIYARVGRKSFHDLRTVVRALFVEQEMFVNQASGLVISPQPGAIDLLPANQDDLFDATAELSVRCGMFCLRTSDGNCAVVVNGMRADRETSRATVLRGIAG